MTDRTAEYISRAGYERLSAELEQLRHVERPKVVDEVSAAAAQGDRSENAEYIYGKKRLREIDRRTRWLEKRLDALTPMDVDAPRTTDRCYFGAWVTVEDEDGKRTTYHVVGAIEADAKRGLVSWQTPIAQALWGLRVGDGVTLPRGEGEIVAIVYDPA